MAEHRVENLDKIRTAVAQDLLSGRIDLLLGWEKGHYWWQSRPLFARNSDDLQRLTWDSFCAANLSIYLQEELKENKKVGLLLKGCDARALNRLVQDRMVDRERVVAYGLPCPGILDYQLLIQQAGASLTGIEIEEQNSQVIFKGSSEKSLDREDLLLEKCRRCLYPDPVVYDQLLLPLVGTRQAQLRFQEVSSLEQATVEERFAYWSKQFERCLRCYACRQACPCCSCRECFVEQEQPRWLGKAAQLSENFIYHLTRSYHGAGRCIECGECQRVCPVGLPLLELSSKLVKDINELYGEYDAGLDPEQEPPLLTYRPDDPAAFVEK
ncbi:MAG TPA: hypothetical protein GX693_03220 [Firmicutes bacterium]|nr:hypothetical protein [Bacillota bacterium]